jgi:hypothetical protein
MYCAPIRPILGLKGVDDKTTVALSGGPGERRMGAAGQGLEELATPAGHMPLGRRSASQAVNDGQDRSPNLGRRLGLDVVSKPGSNPRLSAVSTGF